MDGPVDAVRILSRAEALISTLDARSLTEATEERLRSVRATGWWLGPWACGFVLRRDADAAAQYVAYVAARLPAENSPACVGAGVQAAGRGGGFAEPGRRATRPTPCI